MSKKLRLKCDRDNSYAELIDVNTGKPAFINRGNDVTFELGLFSNGSIVSGADLAGKVVWLEVKTKNDPTLVAQLSGNDTAPNESLTIGNWKSQNSQTATISFPKAETAAMSAGDLWLVVFVANDDAPDYTEQVTYAAAKLKVYEDGADFPTVPIAEVDRFVRRSELGAGLQAVGEWDASTNTPDLNATTPDIGDFYVVTVPGTNSITGTSEDWDLGDRAVYTESGWIRVVIDPELYGPLVLGVADPTVTGVAAPIGTEGYTNETPPRFFKKVGSASTDWEEVRLSRSDLTANVLDYGAVGDGLTDDTAAIQLACNASKSVFFPYGKTFRVVGSVSPQAGTTIFSNGGAEIFVDPSADYVGTLDLNSDCRVSNLTFKGDGIARSTDGDYLGSVIRGLLVENITIENCIFKELNQSEQTPGLIGIKDSSNLRVINCYFAETNIGGIDIDFSHNSGNSIVHNNVSYSSNDLFLHVSSVGTAIFNGEIRKTSHHSIQGNIYIKSKGALVPNGRHGILVHYNGGYSHAIIQGNTIANCNRHGIYLRGSNTIGLGDTGPNIVSNNILRYCGGNFDSGSENLGYNSGIKAESMKGLIIQGNIIESCGYNTDGTVRPYKSAAIESIRGCRNVSVIGNHIKDSNGVGIAFVPTVLLAPSSPNDYSIEKLNISNNNISDCEDASISVNGRQSSGAAGAADVIISGNVVTLKEKATIAGISLRTNFGLSCTNNTIVGQQLTDQIGIAFNGANGGFYLFHSNAFRNLDKGISVKDVFLSGSFAVAYAGHREIGSDVIIDFNTFQDCVNSVWASKTSNHYLEVVGLNNEFKGTTPDLPLQFNSSYNVPALGERIGKDASGNQLLKCYSSVLPTQQQYYEGDVFVINGVNYICTASGTPGTWQTESQINAANLPTYTNDSAAGTGGLISGEVYKTATGELRIKV